MYEYSAVRIHFIKRKGYHGIKKVWYIILIHMRDFFYLFCKYIISASQYYKYVRILSAAYHNKII